jgi:hypothetical protein
MVVSVCVGFVVRWRGVFGSEWVMLSLFLRGILSRIGVEICFGVILVLRLRILEGEAISPSVRSNITKDGF